MYVPAKAVDETLAFIAKNSAQGSWLLFDYYPNCVVDGTCEIGKNIKSYVKQAGEPLQFGIDEDKVEAFLREREDFAE